MSEERKQYWSPWALAEMEACGERYRRVVKEREYRPSGPSRARGRAVHAVAAEANRRKLAFKREKGVDRLRTIDMRERFVSTEEAKEIAHAAFQASVSEGVALSEAEVAAGLDINASLLTEEKAAMRIAESYLMAVAPTVDPVAIEREIIAPVTGYDFEIKGKIDLIDISTGPEMIRDTKTTTKAIPPNAADKSSQLTMYSLLRSQETGTLVDSVGLDNLVVAANGSTSYVRQRSKRDGKDFVALINRIQAADSATKAGVFVPNTDSWKCNARWCEFYTDCRFVVHRPVSIATGSVGFDASDLEDKLKASVENPWAATPKHKWATDPKQTNNKGE